MHTQEALILSGFLVLIVIILAIDMGVFHKKSHEVGL